MKKSLGKLLALLLAAVMFFNCTPAMAASGKWIKSGSRWWYCHTDNTYTAGGWEKIDGLWYRFDKKGWMQTGWVKDGGKWYSLTETGALQGAMRKECFYYASDGNTYYLKSSGAMATGWLKVYESWHYFYPSGKMARSEIVGGKYYVDAAGCWINHPGLNMTKPVTGIWIGYHKEQNGKVVLEVYKSTLIAEEIKPFEQLLAAVKDGSKTLNLKGDNREETSMEIIIGYKDGTSEKLWIHPDGRLYCDGYDYTVNLDALLALYKAL